MPTAPNPASLFKASTEMAGPEPSNRPDGARLTEADAVEIWIARWLRVPIKALVEKYGCDSRRLYEIWWQERFLRSRATAQDAFRQRYPGLADRTSYGYRRIPRMSATGGDQMTLFD